MTKYIKRIGDVPIENPFLKEHTQMTKSEEIMQLINDYRVNYGEDTYAKLQAFADEYQELKYCYSPDNVLRTSVFKDRRVKNDTV